MAWSIGKLTCYGMLFGAAKSIDSVDEPDMGGKGCWAYWPRCEPIRANRPDAIRMFNPVSITTAWEIVAASGRTHDIGRSVDVVADLTPHD
ncbi:hypothetical protein NKJ09_27600 [Mesorhizobium sp. M0189]|uniref:hypothetical protein n=1 Tax=unclassified Mesorhizobium TaxID=325217 RepID=UPI0033397EEF